MHLMDGVTLGGNYKNTQRVQLGRQNMGEHWLLVRTDQGWRDSVRTTAHDWMIGTLPEEMIAG